MPRTWITRHFNTGKKNLFMWKIKTWEVRKTNGILTITHLRLWVFWVHNYIYGIRISIFHIWTLKFSIIKQVLVLFFNLILKPWGTGVSYFNFNALEQEERYENCMIGNSSLKVCMIQEIYVFSIKYVQLKLVSYMYQIQRYENCMICNSSLKVFMVQHVFSIKHVQLKFVAYSYQ